ncbi:MAG: response regulator transcription factor [Anaerolineales bacterium]|nr:response regulator transcription factor [Anaerolineales bacterium]
MRALLYAHNVDEGAVLTVILQRAGFEVRSVSDLNSAIANVPDRPADLFLISYSQGREIALRQVEELRAETVVPIVIIADDVYEELAVELLEKGADLIVPRPYGPRFLMAQVRALMRRSVGMPFFSLPLLTQADIQLDPSTRTIQVDNGESKRLTQLEFRLLFTLMTHAGRVIPAENLVEYVWGYTGEGNRSLVRGLIQRLRSKVEPDPSKPRYILTQPGVGYRFNPLVED